MTDYIAMHAHTILRQSKVLTLEVQSNWQQGEEEEG
jgi:hypothetical protein